MKVDKALLQNLTIVEVKYYNQHKDYFTFEVVAQDSTTSHFYKWFWIYGGDTYKYSPDEDEYFGNGSAPDINCHLNIGEQITRVYPMEKIVIEYVEGKGDEQSGQQ